MNASDERQMLDAISRWLERDVRAKVRELEREDTYPAEMVERMKELGLFGATIPPEYGGLGLPATTYAKIVAAIAEVWMSLTGIFNSHLIMAAAVARFGTDAQKRRFLPKFATGELRGGLALTEPDCGTDLQAIRTRAVREGDEYVITGQKMWATNALRAGAIMLLAVTDPAAEPRHKGMTAFIVEKEPEVEELPGLRIPGKLSKLGYKGVETTELLFEGFRTPSTSVLGGAEGEGKGFYYFMGGIELGRVNIAARAVGIATRAFEEAIRYAQQRETFGKPIAQHQAVQLKLAQMATKIEAARLLTVQAAEKKSAGERADLEAGMAKLFATETAQEAALEAMRIHGGYGYSPEFVVERIYRDAPVLILGEGSNEIQQLVIARRLLERYAL